jgi:hypothetical protein
MDSESGELKAEFRALKEGLSETKSALISWGNQTKQIFFEKAQAIPTITRKIKDMWGMSRKFSWLRINWKHESQVTDWPRESFIEILIRGLGAGPFDDEDEDPCEPRDKFPKGKVRISIAGKILRSIKK